MQLKKVPHGIKWKYSEKIFAF